MKKFFEPGETDFLNVWMIRHGESKGQSGEDSSADPGLSARGIRQVSAAGNALRKIRFDSAHVSPLQRTRETFQYLNVPVAHDPVFDPRLEEVPALTIPPYRDRAEALKQDLFRYAVSGSKNVLLVSHAFFLNVLMQYLLSGDSLAECPVYLRLTNARIGLLRLGREPENFYGIVGGWNLDARDAAEIETLIYP